MTAPRMKLRDGRYLAYKESGVPKENAKFKIAFAHGFSSCRHDVVIATQLSQVGRSSTLSASGELLVERIPGQLVKGSL